jgi:hypothetical protein
MKRLSDSSIVVPFKKVAQKDTQNNLKERVEK